MTWCCATTADRPFSPRWNLRSAVHRPWSSRENPQGARLIPENRFPDWPAPAFPPIGTVTGADGQFLDNIVRRMPSQLKTDSAGVRLRPSGVVRSS